MAIVAALAFVLGELAPIPDFSFAEISDVHVEARLAAPVAGWNDAFGSVERAPLPDRVTGKALFEQVLERAKRGGKPVLVILARESGFDRGRQVRAWTELSSARSDEVLAPFALVERVALWWHEALSIDALRLTSCPRFKRAALVETDCSTPTFVAMKTLMSEPLATALLDAIARDAALLDRHARQNVLAAVSPTDPLKLARVPPFDRAPTPREVEAVPAWLLRQAHTRAELRASWTMLVADAVRNGAAPHGTTWARPVFCTGTAAESGGILDRGGPCGTGFVGEQSKRFLWFYAGRESR